MAELWKWCSRGEYGVRRESYRLHLNESLDHLRWGGKKEPKLLISKNGKIGGECGSVGCPRRGSEDGLERYTRLFTNIRRRALPYFRRRRLRACRMRRRAAFLEPLEAGVINQLGDGPLGSRSVRVKCPRVSKPMGGRLRTVRRGSGVLTLDQRGRMGSRGYGFS